MVSKEFREPSNKPSPFPYKTKSYGHWAQLFDKTSRRFDENSKLIVVEGAHAIGKTQVSKYIAEQFDMIYMPSIDLNDRLYRTQDGEDMRNYNDLLMPRLRPFADKEFISNPLGSVEGSADRYLYWKYILKFENYVFALRHIFNTGQGVVLEDNPFSHEVIFNLAYEHGWVNAQTRKEFNWYRHRKNALIPKPNLILYLDAHPKTVIQNINQRNNSWDKNSPLWTESYLSQLYSRLKEQYLTKASRNSLLLQYDWTQGGDQEIVTEDIERCNFDYYDVDSLQQKDWRMPFEDDFDDYRYRFTSQTSLTKLFDFSIWENVDAKELVWTPEEVLNSASVMATIDSEQYQRGYNPFVGDKVLFKFRHDDGIFQQNAYPKIKTADFFTVRHSTSN